MKMVVCNAITFKVSTITTSTAQMDLRRTCTKFLNEHCCMVADANEILRPQQGLAEKVLVLQKVKNIVRLHSFWI